LSEDLVLGTKSIFVRRRGAMAGGTGVVEWTGLVLSILGTVLALIAFNKGERKDRANAFLEAERLVNDEGQIEARRVLHQLIDKRLAPEDEEQREAAFSAFRTMNTLGYLVAIGAVKVEDVDANWAGPILKLWTGLRDWVTERQRVHDTYYEHFETLYKAIAARRKLSLRA
jgi:hypothetical protein